MTMKKISFTAKKTVIKPTLVKFNTKEGETAFTVKKRFKKPTRIVFFVEVKKKK